MMTASQCFWLTLSWAEKMAHKGAKHVVWSPRLVEIRGLGSLVGALRRHGVLMASHNCYS